MDDSITKYNPNWSSKHVPQIPMKSKLEEVS